MLYEFIDEEGIVHSYKLRTPPRPIIRKREFRCGDKAPEFVMNPADVAWTVKPVSTGRWIHSRELTRRPLVIAFYCEAWGVRGENVLEQLKGLHQKASEAGANFLVITQTPPHQLPALSDTYGLDFSVAYDKNNRIARHFGAYDPLYPVWDRITGINDDVFCPGLFVINPDGKFLFAQLDKNFELSWTDSILDEALVPLQKEEQLKYA